MEVRRLAPDAIRPFFEAHPHPNVLEPMSHPDRKRFLGLLDGDRLVGGATLEKRALGAVQVGGIYVLECLRGTGAGRALLDGAKAEARAWGGRWLVLGAYRRAPDVSPFYRAVGFRTLVPYIPGAASPQVLGAVARGLARLFRVEAGPDAIRVMVARL